MTWHANHLRHERSCDGLEEKGNGAEGAGKETPDSTAKG